MRKMKTSLFCVELEQKNNSHTKLTAISQRKEKSKLQKKNMASILCNQL